MTTTPRHERQPAALLQGRKTLALSGTVATTEAKLDHHARMAMLYAQHWHEAAGLPRVTSSALIRRALERYAHELTRLDPAEEGRAMAATSATHKPLQEDQGAALKRLEAMSKAHPLPPFVDVLAGHCVAAWVASINERAEALAAACMPQKRAGLTE